MDNIENQFNAPPSTPPIQPAPPLSPRPKSKILWIILIIIFILAAGVGVFYLGKQIAHKYANKSASSSTDNQATQTENSAWQTYDSKEYKYSIQFPKNYYYKGGGVESGVPYVDKKDIIISDQENMGLAWADQSENIHVTVDARPSSSNLEKFRRMGHSEDPEIMLGDDKGVRFIGYGNMLDDEGVKLPESEWTVNVYYTIFKNGYSYTLAGSSAHKGEKLDSENFQMMEKIMQTFRITD